MLALYVNPNGRSAVSGHLAAAELNDVQREHVERALACALTDAFYTILMALDGSGSLAGKQQAFHLADEDGRTISNGDGSLEAAAYAAFHENG